MTSSNTSDDRRGGRFSGKIFAKLRCQAKFIILATQQQHCARARCDFFFSSRSLRSSLEVQRAACSQACGAGAFVRGIGSRPAPRQCNARVTDYLRHTTPSAAYCRHTQASGRATCSPDRRSIDRSDPTRLETRGKTRAKNIRRLSTRRFLRRSLRLAEHHPGKALRIIFIFLYNTNILIYLYIVTWILNGDVILSR